jgi:hypothetical protein
MSQSNWEPLEQDREIFERELNTFIPNRIFDAQAHLYCKRFFGAVPTGLIESGPDADLETFFRCIDWITPGRTAAGLFFGFPTPP